MCAALAQPRRVQLLDLKNGLLEVREFVRTAAAAAGLSQTRAAEVVLAAHEVAMNAITHGRGRGAIRVWSDANELVCEVEDHGPGITDPDAGLHTPDPANPRGRGLWIARQLCQSVDIESADPGARVRLHVSLG